MKILVIYHGNCTDGITAGWCAWKHFGKTAEYIEGHYGSSMPDICDKNVYLLDFSYPRADMEVLCKYAESVVVLDHHKTMFENIIGLEDTFDNVVTHHCTLDKSGAGIAWDYFSSISNRLPKKMPYVFPHVQDRDLWKFELPDTKAIYAAIQGRPKTFEEYDKLFSMSHNEYKRLIKGGQLLLDNNMSNIRQIIRATKRTMTIADVEIPVINGPAQFASDAVNIVASENEAHGVAGSYYDSYKGRAFSLRSVETGLDVSVLAGVYGGGGHKHAAGFFVDRNHELAKC